MNVHLTRSSPHLRALFIWLGLPLLVYSAVALFITWPLVTQLSTAVAGGGWGDSFENVRLGWWGGYALQHGLNPLYQSLLGYPDGLFSAAQAAQPLIYWPGALLGLLVGPVAGFNLFLMGITVLNGLSAYWLGRSLLREHGSASAGHTLAALVGGLIFMAFPTLQGHLTAGHLNPLSNYGLPVLALCLWRATTGRAGARTVLLGALAILVLGLANFTSAVYALLPLLLFGGLYLLVTQPRRTLRWSVARPLVLILGGGFLLLLPFYLPLAQEALTAQRPTYLQEGGNMRYSADLLSFVAVSPFTPWTAWSPDFSRDVLGANNTEGAAYLGLVAVALAAGAVLWRAREARVWLVVALGSMIFSFGPLLKWRDAPLHIASDGLNAAIAMPWVLFQDLPFIDISRTPGRFNITTGLALAVLAALGLELILGRIRQPAVQVVLTGLTGVFVLLEYQLFFPFPTIPAALPEVFTALRGRDDVRAVFDVPWDDLFAQKDALYEQTAHARPLLAGYVSRGTTVDPARLALLSDAATGRLSGPALSDAHLRALLRTYGADVIVYHRARLPWDETLAFAQRVFGTPLFRDDWRAVFEVPQDEALPTSVPFTFGASGWWRDAEDIRWLENSGALYFYTAVPLDARWQLQLSPLVGPRTLRIALDGEALMAFALNAPRSIEFWLRAEPGFHTLRLETPESCLQIPVAPTCLLYGDVPRHAAHCALPDGAPGCLSLALHTLDITPAGEMTFRAQPVALSGGLTMQGFRAPQQIEPGGRLIVETSWRATERLPGDYHLFVHMLDAQGKMVAQFDGVPGEDTFPTTSWAAPQSWIEAATLDIPAATPPGVYRLYTGWYRYPELTRLAVEGNAPGAPDSLVLLGEIRVGG